MKKTILFLIVTFVVFTTYAQRPDKSKIMRAKKIAFITENLDLSEQEAEKFWPLYNKFDKAKRKLYKQEKEEIRNKIRSAGGLDNVSEDEAKRYLKLFHKIKASHEEIKASFHNDLLVFLSAKKVLKLEILEHRFNKNMIKRFKERRGRNRRNQ
ncbi:hypothetical protein [Tenacibaculum jejuense]|uniref:Sensor of ECF-type sigma factor n=1 Tax=Tenacibaculum jejuense TaxID=584609 RepID=A0A238U846_9FLAO|nr:hypothetical protein [Tenacibaculum jejuense]SNR15272.1 Protein of unknown function precursor, putative sensor of anti-sigma and ECF sigma factor [Tenacibaculum jejuense]